LLDLKKINCPIFFTAVGNGVVSSPHVVDSSSKSTKETLLKIKLITSKKNS